MDHLGLVEAVDGLGQGIVMGISDTAHGRFDPRFGEAFGVADGDTLGSLVAVNWRPRNAGCPSCRHRTSIYGHCNPALPTGNGAAAASNKPRPRALQVNILPMCSLS